MIKSLIHWFTRYSGAHVFRLFRASNVHFGFRVFHFIVFSAVHRNETVTDRSEFQLAPPPVSPAAIRFFCYVLFGICVAFFETRKSPDWTTLKSLSLSFSIFDVRRFFFRFTNFSLSLPMAAVMSIGHYTQFNSENHRKTLPRCNGPNQNTQCHLIVPDPHALHCIAIPPYCVRERIVPFPSFNLDGMLK